MKPGKPSFVFCLIEVKFKGFVLIFSFQFFEFFIIYFQGAKVLMVGAGGIGCELLKTLALSGFQDIHIVSI